VEEAASLADRLNNAFRVALNEKTSLTPADIILWAQWADALSRQLVPHGIPYIGQISPQDKV